MTRFLIIAGTVAGLCAAVLGAYTYGEKARSPEGVARSIVAACTSAPQKDACYEERIPALYPGRSIPELFEIIRSVRRLDPAYQFCHLLAHKVGSIAIAEDPSRWLSAFPLNPKDGLCSNGFLHGVMIERFREASFDDAMMADAVPELQGVCEKSAYWTPTSLDQGMCYHGLGHLTVSLTDGDPEKAVRACWDIVPLNSAAFVPVCLEGVFMQLFQPVEPDDFQLIAPLKEDLTRERYRAFCARFGSAEAEGACLREAWPLFMRTIVVGEGVDTFCSKQPNIEQESKCYTTVSTIIGRTSVALPERAVSACAKFPKEHRAECFSLSATTIIEEDRNRIPEALARCTEGGEAEACIRLVAQRMRYVHGEENLHEFCAYLPYAYHSVCMSGGGALQQGSR